MDRETAQAAYEAAAQRVRDIADAIVSAGDDADLDQLEADLSAAEEEANRCQGNLDRLDRVERARQQFPESALPTGTAANTSGGDVNVTVDFGAQPRGGKAEHTYRPDTIADRSFFADLLHARTGDRDAIARLERNNREALDMFGADRRDMQNLTTQGSDFVPPLYLADLWVEPHIASRPFADALPKLPLPPTGTTISIPQLASGVTVAARADAGAVSETDGVTATLTHYVNEVAGMVDIGRIAVMRSDPGLDQVIGRTLVRRYNSYLDTQLLAGSGTPPQHDGIRNVASSNSVTYTDATPTAAELVPKIYDAIQQVWDGCKGEMSPDLVLLHPRRAAWLASNLSSTFPLFQLGALDQASGTQGGGFVNNFAGLRVVLDPNIATNYSEGGNTDEDEVYVVASEGLYLMEGPLYARVFEDVGSGNGLIRYDLFAFSAFLSNRYPESIATIKGSGLAAPTF